ncbi:hypothetical protein H072_9736 [Dactylellina haptotyla CBS 200.50]|uniref:Uncharacterized protein n=1 Tax=Dactylellina haptotyla (strain CBS 200.50) TaxID=1284197 RepID=S8A6E2_DACHA|nr:hypothetical protein H072_9736 [Dactylellina haptotyla CBS 200.50]
MTAKIYQVVYPNPLFKDHWALLIPKEGLKGYYLEAAGDALNGFTVEIQEDYDVADTSSRYSCVALSDITDVEKAIEVARGVPPPPKSLRSASSEEPRTRLEPRNCQDWVVDVLQALETEGLVEAGTSGKVHIQGSV